MRLLWDSYERESSVFAYAAALSSKGKKGKPFTNLHQNKGQALLFVNRYSTTRPEPLKVMQTALFYLIRAISFAFYALPEKR
jgi:hypothetical protein